MWQTSKRAKVKPIETTVGRVIFNTVLPVELRFKNQVIRHSPPRAVPAQFNA